MFTHTKCSALGAMLAVVLLAAPATTQASHRRCEKPDVDVESLKAKLRLGHGAWHVSIKYEVELEDAWPDRFDVVISFSERGHTLRDRFGRPIEILDVLDRPTKVDDDELDFERRLSVTLPRKLVRCPKKLKVRVEIVDRCTGRVVDDKTKSVKWKRTKKSKWRTVTAR